jgi:hypothetical protein
LGADLNKLEEASKSFEEALRESRSGLGCLREASKRLREDLNWLGETPRKLREASKSLGEACGG